MTKSQLSKIKKRLEYLRREINAERISYGEIAELQSLARYIDPGDVQLLEWAGVPERRSRRNPGRIQAESATVTGYIVTKVKGQEVEFEYEATIYGLGDVRRDDEVTLECGDLDPYEDLTAKQLETIEQLAIDDAYAAVERGDYE